MHRDADATSLYSAVRLPPGGCCRCSVLSCGPETKDRMSNIRGGVTVKPSVFNTPPSLLRLPFISSLFSPATYGLTPR